ncbi:leucine-rich repeat domain-containing protein, partial [Streptococcus pyogenes]|uniref:leucine-rich repeat domain-containing protein n=1 Tax=Streptococcus pyogenes TaxID=1314 RepID=UPI003DA00FCE
ATKRHVSRRENNLTAAKELISRLTNLTGESSRGIVLKAIGSAVQDDGWMAGLIEWAKSNNLPPRELIEVGILQQQEYVGFPSDEQSLTQLSKNSKFRKGSIFEDHKALEINLNFTPLTCLPKEFCRLSAVHVLYLHGCELEELPEEIGQLSNLYTIDLGKNKLTRLPDSLCSLSRLEALNLHGNNLKCLPKSIVQMESLSNVNLSGNPELLLTNEQKEWLSSFSEDDIFVDDDLLSRPALA